MIHRFIVFLGVMSLAAACATAQKGPAGPWNGRTAAIVLTYDDGLNVHLDNVIPLLDSMGFQGTFYIPGNSPALRDRMDEWRKAAARGHELGNHTLFHPCIGPSLGRNWVKTDYDLAGYSQARMIEEIRLANTMLRAIDGKAQRTFAYTCGDRTAGGVAFTDSILDDFVAGRGTRDGFNTIDSLEWFDLKAVTVDGQKAEALIPLVDEAIRNHVLLIFLFHGVGGEHGMNIDREEHRKLVLYMKSRAKELWVTSLVNVAVYIGKKDGR